MDFSQTQRLEPDCRVDVLRHSEVQRSAVESEQRRSEGIEGVEPALELNLGNIAEAAEASVLEPVMVSGLEVALATDTAPAGFEFRSFGQDKGFYKNY